MSPIKKTSKSYGKKQWGDFKESNGTAENSVEREKSAGAREVNEQAQMTKVFIDHDVASLENLNNGEIPEVNEKIDQAKELAKQAKEEIDQIVEADKMQAGEQPLEQKAEKDMPLKQTKTATNNVQELKAKWLGQEVSLENNGEEEDNKKWTVIKIEDGKAILRNFSKGNNGKVITRSVDVEKLRLWWQEEGQYKELEHNLERKIGIIESLKNLTALDLEELVKNKEFILSIKNALQRDAQLIFDSLSSEDKKNLSGIYLNYFIELVGAICQSNYPELDKILEEIKIGDYQGVEEIIQSPEFKKALTQGEHSLKAGLEFIVKQKYIEADDLQTLSILRQLDYPEINKILEEIKIGDYQGLEEVIQSPEFKLCLKSSLENDAGEIINNINNSTEIDELELAFTVNRFLKGLSAIYQLDYPEINKILEEIKIGDYQGLEQVMQSAEFREALDTLKKFNEPSINHEENSDYKFGKVNLLVTFNAARNIIDAYQQELSVGAQKEIVGDEAAEPIDFSQIENSFKGLHDLFNALDENLNSRGEKEGKSYDSHIIKQIILAAVEGKVALESVPTWGGLREKVAEIKAAVDKAKEEEKRAKSGLSAERIRELREKLRIFKEKRERYLKAKLAYEKVSSSFAGKKMDKKKKEAILKEFYEAQSEYYQARAEYVGDKANRFVNERLKVAEAEAELVVADKKSSKFKEKYHQVIDGFYNGYKKLGEFNLADKVLAKMLFKREQDGRVKRTIKTLVGMGGRFISARTALSFGLVGAGFLLAGTGAGALAVIPLSLRRILGTGGAAFGYYDLQRNFSKQERQIRKLKNKMADEKFHLDSLPQKELENYLNYFEVQATIDGKSPAEDKFYRQLRLEYMRRLKKEKVEKIEGRVEKTIEDKLHAIDKELSGLKIQLKGKNKRRKIVALTAGAVVGSGVLFSLAREWLWGGGGEAAASAASLHGNMHNLPANGAGQEVLWGRTGNINSSAVADSSRHIVEAGHTAGNTLSSEAVKAGAAHATGADTPVAHQFGTEAASFDYQGGKSVWREISHQLRNYFKEKHLDSLLDKKNTATRTYLIDYLKDKIAAKPEDYGLPKGVDINNLSQTGLAKLDWDKLMRGNLQKAIDSAKSLSADAKKAILDNNRIINKLNEQDLIKDWAKADELVNEVKKNFDGSAEFYKDYQQAVQYMQEHVKNLSQQAAENSLNLHSKAALGAHIIHHHPAASTGKVESLATEVPSKEAVTSTGGTNHIKEAVQQPKHHQPAPQVEKNAEHLKTEQSTQHIQQAEEQHQPAAQVETNSHNVASGGAESEISKVDSLTQAAAQETLTKENQNMILKVAEDYVGKKYSMGHDGYDCMTLIKEVGKKVKNNLLKEYVHFIDTHKGTHLTFNEFLKDKSVDFRDASWEVVKNKIEPGTYLVNFNSGGGVTYGPEGHGGILEVRMGPDGQKEFNLIHASTVSLKVAEHHQPLSLHELKIKVDGQTYSGRKIVTAFAKKFKNLLTRDKGGARVYKPELARKIEFYDKSGHQLHPVLEKDGSLRLGYVTKETNLDSYFKYNRDFAKNMTLLRLDENDLTAAIAAK